MDRWRIYYADGRRRDSEEGPPRGEDARGVQVVLQEDGDLGWTTQSGSDYFIYRNGRWLGCDINGLFDYLMDTGLVLFGRMIDRGEYSRIFSEAMADRAFGEKTGYLPRRFREMRP